MKNTQTPRGWEEEFDGEFPELNDFPELGDEIKSFIQSTIDSAVKEERRRITEEVKNNKWGEFINLEQVLSIINPKK